jgi:agmatine/peptidylarginine deiminase
MAVGITTGDPDAVVHILVTGASQQSSATSVLQGAGADLDQVNFITYTSNTVWIRDYGPRFIREDDHRAIVDHTYNRPRPLDDAFPDYLATLWGEPAYDIPLVHGGGNFHLFASGEAFMSDLILDENPGLTEQDVVDYYDQYENLALTVVPGFPTWFDSTQHIDMWMLPVADDEVIIGQYEPSDGAPYTITEDVAADLQARGYTVHRTPGWNSGGTHYTYTNAVVFNDLVFVSEFSGYPAENAEAQAVFAAAFPDHQIIPVDCSQIIHSAGAIHCVVMHVPDIGLLPFSDGFEAGDLSGWTVSFP